MMAAYYGIFPIIQAPRDLLNRFETVVSRMYVYMKKLGARYEEHLSPHPAPSSVWPSPPPYPLKHRVSYKCG